MSKPTALKTVQELMVKANRPYAINDVVEKCGKGEWGKAVIQKCLDTLVDKEILVFKIYGKQKIYFAKQHGNPVELKKQVQLTKQKLNQARQVLKSKETQLNELELRLKSVSKVKSLTALEEEREQLLDDIRAANEKLRYYEAEQKETKLSAQDIKKIESKYDVVTTAYRKRKRICVDMLDAIMEGYPKTKKALIADIGVETDEEVGFTTEMKR